MKYFIVTAIEHPDIGVACASKDADIVNVHELLLDESLAEKWKELKFELRDGGYADFQPNDLSLRLCSKKLKDVLEQAKHSNDAFRWLPAKVDGKTYCVLHLPETPAGVVNESLSVYHKDILVAPVISKEIRAGVFKRTRDNAFETIVSAEVRSALERSGCIGFEFEEVATG